jgi:hypothetical protein
VPGSIGLGAVPYRLDDLSGSRVCASQHHACAIGSMGVPAPESSTCRQECGLWDSLKFLKLEVHFRVTANSVDLKSPIGIKWASIGGPATTGRALGNPLPLEDGIGLMQETPSTITRTMLLCKEAP